MSLALLAADSNWKKKKQSENFLFSAAVRGREAGQKHRKKCRVRKSTKKRIRVPQKLMARGENESQGKALTQN